MPSCVLACFAQSQSVCLHLNVDEDTYIKKVALQEGRQPAASDFKKLSAPEVDGMIQKVRDGERYLSVKFQEVHRVVSSIALYSAPINVMVMSHIVSARMKHY